MIFLPNEYVFSSLNREIPANLMGKLSQLESMVKVLQDDLKKVSYFSVRVRAPHLKWPIEGLYAFLLMQIIA